MAVKTARFSAQPNADQRVSKQDLLVCRGNGNINLVGRGYFPPEPMPDVIFPDTVIALRFNVDQVAPRFVECLWNSPLIRKQITRAARTTSGIFKINQAVLEDVELVVPPLNVQLDVVRHLEMIGHLMTAQRDSFTKLDALSSSLQQRAFRGEL